MLRLPLPSSMRVMQTAKTAARKVCFRNLVTGRASTKGTKYFLESSDIRLQHHLKQSNLYINPMIIGNPFTLQDGHEEAIDTLYYGAVMEDRSNCFYVYSNNDDGTWYTKIVERMVEDGLDRESLVTVANIGSVRHPDEVLQRLEEARQLTDQESIDIAMLNIHPEWKEGSDGDFNGVKQLLEELCINKVLHSYGFSMNIEPFNMHTPAPNRGAGNLFFPAQFEHEINTTMPHCDLMAYPLSPTHAVPHALAMLPAAPEDVTEEELMMYDEYHDRHRKFTRIAVHPFCCYRGHGSATPDELEADALKNMPKSNNSVSKSAAQILQHTQANDSSDPSSPYINGVKEDDPVVFLISDILPDEISDKFGEAMDTLCPALATTPKLEDKALRTVLSFGHEVVIVEPEIKPALGKLKLTPADLVGIDDVAHIFGGFMIPEEIDQALRESIEDEASLRMSQQAAEGSSRDWEGGGDAMEGLTEDVMNQLQREAEKEAEAKKKNNITNNNSSGSTSSKKKKKK